MELIFRFDYGSVVPWVRRTSRGIRAVAGPDTVHCRTDVPLRGEDFRTIADFSVTAGRKTNRFCADLEPNVSARKPKEREAVRLLDDAEEWWREWSDRSEYEGEWRDAVLGSLITLKALTYAPTGGIVAALTTSLPEALGGVRNWDYRYCWLRDATFALYALMIGGYTDEAEAWRRWLVNAVAGTPESLNIMYGVAGERRWTEIELGWLPRV